MASRAPEPTSPESPTRAELLAALSVATDLGLGQLHAAGLRAELPNPRPDGLTPREIEVLGLLARGGTTKQVASSLVISEKR